MTSRNGRAAAFDLNAARARQAAGDEAADKPWPFTFGDPPQTFTFKPQRRWKARTKRLLDEGNLEAALELILDDPAGFWALDPEMGDLEALFNAYGEYLGVGDLGESAASAPRVSTRM